MKRQKLKLHEGEKIIAKSRSSKWFLSFVILKNQFYWGIPIVILAFVISFFLEMNFFILPSLSFLILFALNFAYKFSLWKDPIFVVTDRRLIFDHDRSFWSSKRFEIKLENVSDILSPKSGFLKSMLNFGDIVVTPISGSERYTIMYIPNASSIVDKITEVYGRKSEAPPSQEAGSSPPQEEAPDQKADHEMVLKNTPGVLDVFSMSYEQKDRVSEVEDRRNRASFEVLRRRDVYCLLVDKNFPYTASLTKANGKEFFPSLNFKEIPEAICAFPGGRVYLILCDKFPGRNEENRIATVGV